MTDWKQFIADHVQHAPFIMITRNGIDYRKLDLVRVIEGLLIAAGTAIVTMYGVQKSLETEMIAMKQQMAWQWAEVAKKIDRLERDYAIERSERVDMDRDIMKKIDSIHSIRK